MRIIFIGLMLLTLNGCTDDTVEQEEPIRGLRTFQVANATQSVERRYPSVIQPHDETRLAFEVGGQLQAVNLAEGQSVKLNDVLLKLDASTFQLQVQESEAVVAQATAAYRNGKSNFDRQAELWEKRMIPRSAFDDAKAAVDTARAQLEQSKKRLEIVQDNLAKTELRAPFDGIIASVAVDSFATISAGQRTLTLYAENAFEAAFTVPSSVINSLSLGQAVRMLVSDLPKTVYSGRITELGSRASQFSAFPTAGGNRRTPGAARQRPTALLYGDSRLDQSGRCHHQ